MVSFFSKKITRRGFVAAATASVAATALSLEGCSKASTSEELLRSVQNQFPEAQVEYLDVDSSQILLHTDMTVAESLDQLRQVNSFELPLGSLVYQSSSKHALVVAPGASSKALIRLGFVDFESGSFLPVLGQALGANEDYVIYDACASASLVAWVECNMVDGLWRVYAAPLVDGITDEATMQSAQLIDEGEGTYSPPQMAVSGTKLYWTVMPDPKGEARSEDSYLKAAEFPHNKTFSGVEPYTAYTSHGRMITKPVVSDDVLTIVPRVDTDTVYYQMTTLDLETDTPRNIAILPPSRKVANAIWGKKGFIFGIEGIDAYAKGLALFGTYQQLGDGTFLYINKVPTSPAVQIGDMTFVKSTKNILGLDPGRGSVIIVDTPTECVSYGDILAGAGRCERLAVYTTVTSRMGQEKGTCNVRVFDLV